MRHNFEVVYDALEDRLHNKPYFVNLRNVLSSRTEPAYKPDGVHLNDYGRKRIAEAMRVALEKGWARARLMEQVAMPVRPSCAPPKTKCR